MKRYLVVIALLVMSLGAKAQGIEFFEGSLQEAMVKAKEQKKDIFIDFYAVWCGPCKQMAREAFPDVEVGRYFNAKFVSCKIDAERPEVKDLVERYGVKAYPTIVLIKADGQPIVKHEGMFNASQLLRWAQTAMDDVMTYDKLYEAYRTDKNNENLTRQLLLGAGDFIAAQQGSNRERWMLRIERLYSDYRKQKPLEQWFNPTDFSILLMYHTQPLKNDAVLEFVVANYDKAVQGAGADKVDPFILSLNTLLTEDLARKGDMEYKKSLARINGDMKPSYDNLMKSEAMTPFETMSYLNDALYEIYNRKSIDKYIALTDEYLTKLASTAGSGDYSAATRTLYEGLDGKLTNAASSKAIEWLTKSLSFEGIDTGERMELLIMMGDCYKMLADGQNAKKCYNQAYVTSLQFGNRGLSAQIQAMMNDL